MIFPRLTLTEALDITRIYSVADALTDGQPLVRARPFISHAAPYDQSHRFGRWRALAAPG